MNELNNLVIGDNESLFIDGVELKSVESYALQHSACGMAELTIKMAVTVNQVDSELKKPSFLTRIWQEPVRKV